MKKKSPFSRPNNENAIQLKDKESRQQAYKAFLLHVEGGDPLESFVYSNEKGERCCWKTLKKYMEESPGDFPSILMDIAMAKRYGYWFNIGRNLSIGKIKHGSPVTWSNIMRNIFKEIGWDKDDSKQSSFTPEQESVIKSLFEQIEKLQKEAKEKKSP